MGLYHIDNLITTYLTKEDNQKTYYSYPKENVVLSMSYDRPWNEN